MSFIKKNNAKITNRPSGGGDKLQGLAPKSTAFFQASSTGRQYSTDSGDGSKRHNHSFCINQLGGIGRHRSQFRSNADGAMCKELEDITLNQAASSGSQVNMSVCHAACMMCMDFRLIDDTSDKLTALNPTYENQYDLFCYPGGSIGYNRGSNPTDTDVIPNYVPKQIATNDFANWPSVFNDTVNLAHVLHNIDEILIIDHMYCGGFRHAYSELAQVGGSQPLGNWYEFNRHIENLQAARRRLIYTYTDPSGDQYITNTGGTNQFINGLSGEVFRDNLHTKIFMFIIGIEGNVLHQVLPTDTIINESLTEVERTDLFSSRFTSTDRRQTLIT